MAVIDIGSGAIDRASFLGAYTILDLGNSANDTGTLDTFEIFALTGYALGGCVVGTFYGSSTNYTSRDSETIGDVVAGSKQTFTGKSCNVTSGDIIGIYYSSGRIERDTSGFSGVYYKAENQFGAGLVTFTLVSDDAISVYATGATVAAGNPYYYYLQQ